jgi:hypothetical protein
VLRTRSATVNLLAEVLLKIVLAVSLTAYDPIDSAVSNIRPNVRLCKHSTQIRGTYDNEKDYRHCSYRALPCRVRGR